MPGIISAKPDELAASEVPAPFPVDALPPVLAEITRAIAETTGSPLDICAPCVLATASACLGAGLLVNSAPGCVSAPNLYVLVVKPSGAGGSVAYNHATAPLRGYQATAMREFDEVTKPQLERRRDTLRADYEDAVKARRKLRAEAVSQAEIKAKESELDSLQVDLAAVEAQLCPPYVMISDTTPESLAALLFRRGEVLAHFDSDANDTIGSILGIRYGNGQHANDSLHLKAFSCESFAISRKGTARGGSMELFLKRPTLACLFVVTPDAARKFFASERMMTGGLLARFLVVDSRAKPLPWRESGRIETAVSQQYEAAAFALLNTYRNRSADGLSAIEMTGEARQLFAEHWKFYCDHFEPGFSAFEARHTENAIRIALVLHAWRNVSFEPDGSGGTSAQCHAHELPLEIATARDALRIAEWFERQQAEMLAPMKDATRGQGFEKVCALCERRGDWIITARDLVSSRITGTAEEADKLLAVWEQEGRAVRVPIVAKTGAGAKPTKPRFQIRKQRIAKS